jgi:hypothetical protein
MGEIKWIPFGTYQEICLSPPFHLSHERDTCYLFWQRRSSAAEWRGGLDSDVSRLGARLNIQYFGPGPSDLSFISLRQLRHAVESVVIHFARSAMGTSSRPC